MCVAEVALSLQESLECAADSLLTATLTPFLAGLCSQLALQSSLLTKSTTSLREQVSQHHHPSIPSSTGDFLLQMQSHGEWVSRFVGEQNQKIAELSAAVQRENSQQVCLIM